MTVYQKRSKRKVTGGRYLTSEKKRLSNTGSLPAFTKVGPKKVRTKRHKGGNPANFLLAADKINVINPKTKKAQVTEVVTVLENSANRNFIRRNIITKGTILETKLGKVKVTSRPGQVGTLNGVLIS